MEKYDEEERDCYRERKGNKRAGVDVTKCQSGKMDYYCMKKGTRKGGNGKGWMLKGGKLQRSGVG